jgi:hypothetical protein
LDGLPAFDPGGHIDGLTGLVQRRSLFPATVRSMFVVVLRVLSEDLPQMQLQFVEDRGDPRAEVERAIELTLQCAALTWVN